jgi:predicted transposase YbfD/YdcC
MEYQITSLYMALTKNLKDSRDNRGKRHDLAFTLVLVLMAILSGKTSVSSIHAYMFNRYPVLVFGLGDKVKGSLRCISRAQLPRVLVLVKWEELFRISWSFITINPSHILPSTWLSIDGKELRGSLCVGEDGKKETRGEALVSLVVHGCGQIVNHSYYQGDKESEITCVRELLKDSKLPTSQITLDSLHSNPLTTALIAQCVGVYLVQVKENQQELLAQLKSIPLQKPLFGEWTETEKSHGRINIRNYKCYNISNFDFDQRWEESKIATLCIVDRLMTEVKTGKIMKEISYYISNKPLIGKDTVIDIGNAIRGHWTVENGHQVRDVTFKEDYVRTKFDPISRVLAICRTIAIEFIRKFNFHSFAQATRLFNDNNNSLFDHLFSAKFL